MVVWKSRNALLQCLSDRALPQPKTYLPACQSPCKVIKPFFFFDPTSFSSVNVAAPLLGPCSKLYLQSAGENGLFLCFPRVLLNLVNPFLLSSDIFVRGTQLSNFGSHHQGLPVLLGHRSPSYSRNNAWGQLSLRNCSAFRSEAIPHFSYSSKRLTWETEYQGKAYFAFRLAYKDAAKALHPKLTFQLFLISFVVFSCP